MAKDLNAQKEELDERLAELMKSATPVPTNRADRFVWEEDDFQVISAGEPASDDRR